jgi:diaminopimelate epimerase
MTRIAKAHGLGNDFLLVAEGDAPADPSAWARRLCDRHVGVGADGILLYSDAPGGTRMRLINADGGEAEISANGLRCLAAFRVRAGAVPARHVVTTGAGPREVSVEALGGERFRVATDLGAPVLDSDGIPVDLHPPAPRVIDHWLDLGGREVAITATSMGNPHCAVFLDAPADDGVLATMGPALERHPFFPRRTNVEFVTAVSRSRLRVRFWERGVGYTRASGTGSASAAVASIITNRADRDLVVECDGGELTVQWPEGGTVRQTGEVEVLFEGDWVGPEA